MILETILIGGGLMVLANIGRKRQLGNITVYKWTGVLDKYAEDFQSYVGIGQLIVGQPYAIAEQRKDKYGVTYVYIVRPGENFGWVAMDDLIKLQNNGTIKLT